MSSSNDERVTGALAWLNLMNTQNQARRRFWVHAYWRANSNEYGVYKIFKNLNLHLVRFQSFYKMGKSSSYLLFTKVSPVISEKGTNFRQSISPFDNIKVSLKM
jgi:hypothetical protein